MDCSKTPLIPKTGAEVVCTNTRITCFSRQPCPNRCRWVFRFLQNTCKYPAKSLSPPQMLIRYSSKFSQMPLKYPSEPPKVVPEGILLKVPSAEDPSGGVLLWFEHLNYVLGAVLANVTIWGVTFCRQLGEDNSYTPSLQLWHFCACRAHDQDRNSHV